MTEAERFLWQHIRKKQLHGYRFRRQHPIGRYIVDFICLEARLVIELDGGQHQDQANSDQYRDNWLFEHGFHVLRFWNNQIFIEIEAVLETIGQGNRT